MKLSVAVLLLGALPAMAQPLPPYASAATVAAALEQAKAQHKGAGNTNVKLAGVPGYTIQLEYRSKETPPTVHPTEAELIEVVGGGCTLVTGGTLVGVKPAQPGAATLSGTAIEGGSAQVVHKGDYILVPAGTPHWYKDVQGELVTVAMHMPAGH